MPVYLPGLGFVTEHDTAHIRYELRLLRNRISDHQWLPVSLLCLLQPNDVAFKMRALRSEEVNFKSYGTAVNTSYLTGMRAVFRFEIPCAAALMPDLSDGLGRLSCLLTLFSILKPF